MNTRIIIASLLATLGSLSAPAQAVDVFAGNGIGFSNKTLAESTGPWVANMVFSKQDLKSGTTGEIYTGQAVTPAVQSELATKGGVAQVVHPTRSMAWCDPASNPDGDTNIANCWGWAMFSKWVVIDLNALQKGNSSVWVTITAERYNDGDEDTTDDDLIPALTVFQGRQDVGVHLHSYPNKFQKDPFWAWKLKPFAGGKTKSTGYSTAYATATEDKAEVTGRVMLKSGNNNYLTVAVGGDARHADASQKHPVNFKLKVKLSRKEPKSSGNGSNNQGLFDACGCTKGVDQWHATMGHCMAVGECELPEWKNGPPGIRCQTSDECDANGGRWLCTDPDVKC